MYDIHLRFNYVHLCVYAKEKTCLSSALKPIYSQECVKNNNPNSIRLKKHTKRL